MENKKTNSPASLSQEELREHHQTPDQEIRKKLKAEAQNFFYSDSTVLRNKYRITNQKEFVAACARDAKEAMEGLRTAPLPEKIDSSYLKSLHKKMFSKTFEWAGHTRDERFTFADGSVASAPLLKEKEFTRPFAVGKEIERGFKQLDEMLLEKDDLQKLTREEFVEHASQIMSHLYSLNPFREGNRRTIQLFVEKLGQAAGYNLDYSLVSKKRKALIRTEAVNNGDMDPIKHLLEDISNPESLSALREFTDEMNQIGLGESNYRLTVAARGGHTYRGVCRGSGDNGFMMDVNGTFVVGNKKYLSPERVKTLKIGDHFSFTAPLPQEAKKVLIPKENVPSLTNEELSQRVYESALVKSSLKNIQTLCKVVYGKENILQNKLPKFEIPMTRESFNQGEKLLRNIGESPESVHRLRGVGVFGLKSSARQHAEANLLPLCHALVGYVRAVRDAQMDILESHTATQIRCEKSVEMPRDELKNLFSMSKEEQQKILASSPELTAEAQLYFMKLQERLSPSDLAAIHNRHYRKLSESLGTSMDNAEEISAVVKQTEEICSTIQQQHREMNRENDRNVYQSSILHIGEQSVKIDATPIKADKIVEFAKQERAKEEIIQSSKVGHATIESIVEKSAETSVKSVEEKGILTHSDTVKKQTEPHKVGYAAWGSISEKSADIGTQSMKEKGVSAYPDTVKKQTEPHKVGYEKIGSGTEKSIGVSTQSMKEKGVSARTDTVKKKTEPHKVGYAAWESTEKQPMEKMATPTKAENVLEFTKQEKTLEEQGRQRRAKAMTI
ncbi:BID domain-containing T4SS effector [Bartonella sp. B23]